MSISTIVITARLKDLSGSVPSGITDATLHVTNDRSFNHTDTTIGPFELIGTFNGSGVATVTCIETTTPSEKLNFFITMKEGTSTRVINFKPAVVPTSSADLTSITTVQSSEV